MFPVEVFHSFVVQKAVGVDASGDDVSVIHLSAELGPPTSQDDGGGN